MKKMVRSYGVFTSTAYRVLALVVLPLVLVAFSALLLWSGAFSGSGSFEMTLTSYAVLLETMADYWLFGGMLSRESPQMELFKTSKEGLALLRRAAVFDCVRRFLYFLGYGLFCCAMTGVEQNLVTALAACLAVTAALNLSRHVQVLQMHMLIAFGAEIVYVALVLPAWMLARGGEAVFAAELILFLVLVAVASVMSVWHILYCVKGSYYEK